MKTHHLRSAEPSGLAALAVHVASRATAFRKYAVAAEEKAAAGYTDTSDEKGSAARRTIDCRIRFMLVSVVISVLNGVDLVAGAIASAQAQARYLKEIVVVNDGSTDETAAILDHLATEDRRINVHHGENRGHAEALNIGIGLATGRYVAILDHDDRASPDRLAHQVEFLEHRPEVLAVSGAAEYIDRSGRTFDFIAYPEDPGEVRRRLEKSTALVHSGATIRRDALLDVGGYRRSFKIALDYDLWLRLSEVGELANVPQTVVQYRVHAGQGSSQIERVALETVAARASAAARRTGALDMPLDRRDLSDDELRQLLAGREQDVLVEIAVYGSWYVRALAGSGDRRTALHLLKALEERTAREGNEAALVALRKAQASLQGGYRRRAIRWVRDRVERR